MNAIINLGILIINFNKKFFFFMINNLGEGGGYILISLFGILL